MAKAVALGIGAPEAFAGGVDFAHYVPAELNADEVAAVSRDRIAGEGGPGIARLVIDNIDNLLDGVLDASRRLGFVSALVAHLGAAGVTTCFTQDIAATGGREMQAQLDEFSIYCDNLLLLRQLEYRAQMHRVVSVVKMRNSDHDRTLREFTIGQGGPTILSPEQTAGGVLEALGRVGAKGLRTEDGGLRTED